MKSSPSSASEGSSISSAIAGVRADVNASRSCACWPALVAALVAVAAYAITLRGNLVCDDLQLIADPRYSHPPLWWQFWTQEYIPGAIDNLYRPLTCMTLAFEYWIHGLTLWPYHLVNILLHAGVAAAVAELGRRILGTRVAWVAGILFAVHPVHVEVIAGVILRHESLCALATLGGMCLFLRPMTGPRVVAILGCFVAALLTKEQGVLFPVMLGVLAPVRARLLNTLPSTSDNPSIDRKRLIGLFVGLCWLLAAYLIYRESILRFWWPREFMEWRVNPLVRSTGAERLLMPLVLVGRYVGLLVAPVHLSLDYGSYVIGWRVNWHQPWIYIGLASVLLWLGLFARAVVRRDWVMVFLLVCTALPFGLIINLVSLIGTIFGERLMYLPSAFFLLIIAAWLARIRSRNVLACVTFILAGLGTLRTVTYAAKWNNPEQLYLADINYHPNSISLYMLTANYYLRHHEYAAAQRICHRMIAAMQDTWESYGITLDYDLQMKDFADAQAVYKEGMRRCPTIDLERYRGKVGLPLATTSASTRVSP